MLRTEWRPWSLTGIRILVIALSLSSSISAHAGLVSGSVNDAKGKFQPGEGFRVKDASGKVVKDSVKTDESKGYSLFLPPGLYTIEFSDGRSAIIQSHPEPIQQNINLK